MSVDIVGERRGERFGDGGIYNPPPQTPQTETPGGTGGGIWVKAKYDAMAGFAVVAFANYLGLG